MRGGWGAGVGTGQREDTFKKVVNDGLVFPASPVFSPELKDLLTRLLDKNAAKRLGVLSLPLVLSL
jgi:hypothetical protein